MGVPTAKVAYRAATVLFRRACGMALHERTGPRMNLLCLRCPTTLRRGSRKEYSNVPYNSLPGQGGLSLVNLRRPCTVLPAVCHCATCRCITATIPRRLIGSRTSTGSPFAQAIDFGGPWATFLFAAGAMAPVVFAACLLGLELIECF